MQNKLDRIEKVLLEALFELNHLRKIVETNPPEEEKTTRIRTDNWSC